MKTRFTLLLCFVLLCSHDMYLKMDSYFLEPNTDAVIQLYNGTFDKSENVITRDRMLDVSLMGNGIRSRIDDTHWTEKDSVTLLNFKTGKSGTWVAGVSTAAKNIEMQAEDFNNYLEHDGVIDMLEFRTKNDLLKKDAIEKYSKHVKAIFQVGNLKTNDWSTVLGYPIEFVPLSNPYKHYTGDTIRVKLIRDGNPLKNQLVYADYRPSNSSHTHNSDSKEHGHSHSNESAEHNHKHESNPHIERHSHDKNENEHNHEQDQVDDSALIEHQHTGGQKLRTDSDGIINVTLIGDGIWFLRTIHLENSEETGLTHESNWATLTFEVSHSHDSEHQHSHLSEEGIPSYVFWIASILIIAGLFFYFNRKGSK